MSPKQGRPSAAKAAAESPGVTRLESDEEIRRALQARRSRQTAQGRTVSQPPGAQAMGVGPVEVEPGAEGPVERPPVGVLCVLDDGKLNGEWVRLRADRTVIGRTEGDV